MMDARGGGGRWGGGGINDFRTTKGSSFPSPVTVAQATVAQSTLAQSRLARARPKKEGLGRACLLKPFGEKNSKRSSLFRALYIKYTKMSVLEKVAFFSSIPFNTLTLRLVLLPPSRNSVPGSHIRLFSSPPYYGTRLALLS